MEGSGFGFPFILVVSPEGVFGFPRRRHGGGSPMDSAEVPQPGAVGKAGYIIPFLQVIRVRGRGQIHASEGRLAEKGPKTGFFWGDRSKRLDSRPPVPTHGL